METCLTADTNAPTQPAPSRWGAFGYLAFTVIWTASVVSNVGTGMFDTASGWLITSLDANPITVSLVQVAISLPLFMFTQPCAIGDTCTKPKRNINTGGEYKLRLFCSMDVGAANVHGYPNTHAMVPVCTNHSNLD